MGFSARRVTNQVILTGLLGLALFPPVVLFAARVPIGPLVFESDRAVSLMNVFTGEHHPVALSFLIETSDPAQQLTDKKAESVRTVFAKNQATTAFEYADFLVERTIQAGPTKGFCEVLFRVKSRTGKRFGVERVICGDFRFDSPFSETVLHDDASILAAPINLFLRTKRGGVILGIAYPYQQFSRSRDGRKVSVGYQVQAEVPEGQRFETEPMFIGSYEYLGLGLYKPLAKVPYRFITPNPQERDLGEIRAMQEYVRTKLPYFPVAGDRQFFMFLNSWWAGKSLHELEPVIDLMAKVGVPEVMTKETEYGLSNHITRCPALENLPDDYQFSIPEMTRRVMEYAGNRGVKLSTFVNPPRAFRSEWEIRDKSGQPVKYGAIPTVCFASPQAADFSVNVWDQMLKAGKATFLGFDGRILTAFNEVDSTYFGKIGPIQCFAPNHGHRPGFNAYQDYKNVQRMFAELRKRNPNAFLEVYWGVKRGMPWTMANFNGCESLYESNGSQDDRMQAWYNQNYRYLPPYQNFAQLKGYTDSEFRKSVISCLGAGSHLQLGVGVKLLDRSANQEFFRKWTSWANENHSFLNVKYDLFGQPWAGPVDGSARIVGNRGFLFLFNESGADRVAEIALDSVVGLNGGGRFDLAQIYPDERPLYRGKRYGQTIQIPIPAGSASIVRVEPAGADPKPLPSVVWNNLGAEARMDGQDLVIDRLQGFQGQIREIVLLLGDRAPSRLRVNGVRVPFRREGQALLAGVRFGQPLSPKVLPEAATWDEGAPARQDGLITLPDSKVLRSREVLGDGVYEVDLTCNFSRGGFYYRANESRERGVLAMALLSWFAGTNGNIAFWPANKPAMPIHLTLGETLVKGKNYRFHIESFGSRQSFSILDPTTGQRIVGPLDYVIDSVEPAGRFGVALEKGQAGVGRLAFAPAPATLTIEPAAIDHVAYLHAAFTPREMTKKYGQQAPVGTPFPGGQLLDADYAKEQEALWGGKEN